MKLKRQEREILDGKHGEAQRICLSVLVQLGELYGAEKLIDISMVHDDSVFYVGDAPIEFAEHIAQLGGKVTVPTSLNACIIDHERHQEYRVSKESLEKNKRLEKAHLSIGAIPTWTCAPYQSGLIPRFGEHIAWAESNATAFANSVIGARTNRIAGLVDICAAIAGKIPEFGLHLSKNRRAKRLIKLETITNEMFADDAIFPLLGFIFGELAEDQVTAIAGIPNRIKTDNIKGFSAAAASSGAVALFHMIGVTPEAQTQEMCFQGRRPERVFKLTPGMIRDAEDRLYTASNNRVDLIALGCPHFSLMEFRELLQQIEGKQVHKSITFWVFTSRSIYGWINNCGILDSLKKAGVTVFTDGCPLLYPQKSWNFHSMMTNSVKMANYCYAQTGHKLAYGSLQDCVKTAIEGKVRRRKKLWRKH